MGVFEFAGVNAGDYAPLRLLPLPRAQQLFNVTMALRPLRDLSIGGEIAASMRRIVADAHANAQATRASEAESRQLLALAAQLQGWIDRFQTAS